MQWGQQVELWNTQDTNDYINNLAYVTHHKHAYILPTYREIEKEGEGWDFAVQKNAPNKHIFSKYQPPEDRNRTTTDKKTKQCTRLSIFPNTYKTEKDRCKERNIRQLHSSHIKGVFCGVLFRQFLIIWVARMSDFQLKNNTDVDQQFFDMASTERQNIDYAWLGQFVWAVVYQPFIAQSIGISKMTMNVFMMMLVGAPVWKILTGATKNSTHWWCFWKSLK